MRNAKYTKHQLMDIIDNNMKRDNKKYKLYIQEEKEKFAYVVNTLSMTSFQRVYHWKLPEVAFGSISCDQDIGFEYSEIYGLIFIQSTSHQYKMYTLSMENMDQIWILRTSVKKTEASLDIISKIVQTYTNFFELPRQ